MSYNHPHSEQAYERQLEQVFEPIGMIAKYKQLSEQSKQLSDNQNFMSSEKPLMEKHVQHVQQNRCSTRKYQYVIVDKKFTDSDIAKLVKNNRKKYANPGTYHKALRLSKNNKYLAHNGLFVKFITIGGEYGYNLLNGRLYRTLVRGVAWHAHTFSRHNKYALCYCYTRKQRAKYHTAAYKRNKTEKVAYKLLQDKYNAQGLAAMKQYIA